MAFLVVLETLSPTERAVFLLRDVFGYEFDEIASVVDKSTDNCRQLLVRARKHVDERRPRFEASAEQRRALAARFFAAVQSGDLEGLQSLLAADVTFQGDGGGKAPATARAIVGVDKVGRWMLALVGQIEAMGNVLQLVEVNGQPGAMCTTPEGEILNVMSLDIVDGQVQAIRGMVNPDKLRHLGPVADLRALMKASRVRPLADDPSLPR